MWKSIIKQMWNRRRSNAWIAIELLLVFCLTWYIVDYLFVYHYNQHIPSNRDIRNTLQVNISELPPEHPDYRAEEVEEEALLENYQRLLQAIEDYPGVESVGISYSGASPGSGNFWGIRVYLLPDTSRIAQGQRIPIDPAYDFFKVFRHTADKGQRMVSAADFDWGVPNGVVAGKGVEDLFTPQSSLQGKELNTWKWEDNRFVVIGVIDDIKRFDYTRPQKAFYLARTLAADNVRNAEISIRHNATFDTRTFRDKFKEEMIDRLRVGNFYLQSVIPYTTISDNTKQMFGMTNEIKLRIYLMLFFLLNILLCTMGTFWYRVNTRREEIGIRRALGSNGNAIHKLFLLEGLVLLSIIVVPAMLIEIQFIYAGMIETLGKESISYGEYLPDNTVLRFLITNAITWIILAVIVVFAIWYPARSAGYIKPVDALRDE